MVNIFILYFLHKIGFIPPMDFKKCPKSLKYEGKNILSIDYGKKVTGLGQFRPGFDLSPYPFDKLIYKSDEDLIIDLKRHIDTELIEVFVVGIPYLTDGGVTPQTKLTHQFALLLEKTFPDIEVYTQDETLSTFEAKERMLNSPRYNFKIDMKQIDALSAAIILEDFIKNDQLQKPSDLVLE